VNLTVKKGTRFGLLGPNGAGKTTLLSLMTGVLKIQTGTIEIFGQPLHAGNRKYRGSFGLVPQELSFYEELTPGENLDFFGAWYGLPKKETRQRANEILDLLGLTQARHKAVKEFSGGMKRRLNLAIGVLHRPRLLFLDEPTTGVDVQTRHAIINYLTQLNRQGATIIYTSHLMKEAEELCEEIALIDGGQIIAHDRLGRLAPQGDGGLEALFLKLTGKAYRD